MPTDTETNLAFAVRDLVKIYGKGASAFTALGGITLDIKQGESLAIIGKSGSGKSTLMHLLALLDKPTSGTIAVSGEAAAELSARKLNALRNKRFGFVFQQFYLNANSTVLDNVILPLKIAGVHAAERRRLGMKVLEQVELADKAKNKAKDLSGGQKQRLVIARALVNNPQIIFADEPTGNLDSVTGQHVEDLLFDLNKSQGITLIIVTHDEDLARRCSRAVRIHDGLITGAAGAPKAPARVVATRTKIPGARRL